MNLNAPTQIDEGSWLPVEVTFDCDDYDTLNLVRWSRDGGATWEESQVYVNGTAIEHYYFGGGDQGTITWDLEIEDSEGNVVSAGGTITVNNVAPTLTLTSSPAGTTIHDHSWVNLSANLWDPAFKGDSDADPLTITIDWGAGLNQIEVFTLDPVTNSGEFNVWHQYALAADQTVPITVTVDDGDTGTDSESFSLAYDDMILTTLASGEGVEGGNVFFSVNTTTESGAISRYDFDVDGDDTFDVTYFEDASGILPGQPYFEWSPTLTLTPGTYTGKARITNTVGASDLVAMSTLIHSIGTAGLVNTGVTSPLTPPGGSVNVGATIGTINWKMTALSDAVFMKVTDKAGQHWLFDMDDDNPNNGKIELDRSKVLSTDDIVYHNGVRMRIDFDSWNLLTPNANMPYFVQKATSTASKVAGGVRETVYGDQYTFSWFDDNSDASQFVQNATRKYQDSPGMARFTDKLQKSPSGQVTALPNVTSAQAFSTPDHAAKVADQYQIEYHFHTYLVDPASPSDPIGYVDWGFTLSATATGWSVSGQSASWVSGINWDSWGC